jgi:DNA-directed RNA polymerase
MDKQEAIPFLTPWFTARFPKISKADTKGQYADGKFKTDGVLDDAAYAVVEKTLKDAAKHFWPGEADVSLPLKKFYANKEDKAAKKSDGRGLTLKSKYQPACFDAKKTKLPPSVQIGGGSVIRVASAIFPWSKTTKFKGEEVTEYGISLRLGDVQVRKLVEFQAQGDGSAFDADEEGFTYEGGDEGGEQFNENDPTGL